MPATKPLNDGLAVSVVTLLAIEIVAGFVGNLRICLLLYKREELRKVPHILLGQLSITGLLVCGVYTPTLLSVVVMEQYLGRPAPTLLCICRYSSSVFIYVLDSLTLVAMAVDRDDCVYRPFNRRLTPDNAYKAVLAIWCVAVVLTAGHVPLAFHDADLGCISYFLKNVSILYLIILGNVLSISTTVCIFSTMVRVVKKLRSSEFYSQSHQRSEVRITKLSLGIMAGYVLSIFPLILHSITISAAGITDKNVKDAKLFMLALQNSNFVVNPFLHSEMCKAGRRVQEARGNNEAQQPREDESGPTETAAPVNISAGSSSSTRP